MINRKNAAVRAQHWIIRSNLNEESKSLQQLGLLLCDRIKRSQSFNTGNNEAIFSLPDIGGFVRMIRSDLLKMTYEICLAPKENCRIGNLTVKMWSKAFGGIALSYAKVGDLSMVAAIVRSAAHLGFSHTWLNESEIFLLDQQQPDGSFGLLALEIELLKNELLAKQDQLRLTVEVLWALTERAGSLY